MQKKVNIEFQYFSTCPQASLLKYRLYESVNELEDKYDFNIHETLIETNEDAQKTNFRGSPTVLINEIDLEEIPEPDHPSLTCRYYPEGLPSTNDIKKRIEEIIKG